MSTPDGRAASLLTGLATAIVIVAGVVALTSAWIGGRRAARPSCASTTAEHAATSAAR